MISTRDTRLSVKTHVPSQPISSLVISAHITILLALLFALSYEETAHWFLIPVTLCGIIIGQDTVDWLRGRLDTFSPVGILGLLGFHFFFLAPTLHVVWDYWLAYVVPPDDWRPWIGVMAVLNLMGLLVYRFGRSLYFRPRTTAVKRIRWQINPQRFWVVLAGTLMVTGLLQMMVYIQSGGIMGYITAASQENAFQGLGIIFVISERFPIVAIIGFAVFARGKKNWQSYLIIGAAILAFFILQIFFGGLRGSRSSIVWSLFWAVGVIHLWVRPISKNIIYVGVLILVVFMYLYGFYKGAGTGAFDLLTGATTIQQLESETNRSLQTTILQDLGRSDIQAFLLYRMMRPDNDYQLALGRTYYGGMAILVPSALWPNRPPHKVKEGTEAQYGTGAWIPGRWEASNVYGLAGETMLNFGPILVPFSFVLLGLFVRRVQNWSTTWDSHDARLLLLPVLVNLCFAILVGDSDNLVWFLFKDIFTPFVVISLGSDRIAVDVTQSNA